MLQLLVITFIFSRLREVLGNWLVEIEGAQGYWRFRRRGLVIARRRSIERLAWYRAAFALLKEPKYRC